MTLGGSTFDFEAAYTDAQERLASLRHVTELEPLNQGEAIKPKPLGLLQLQNDTEDLVEALLTRDLGRTQQMVRAALKTMDTIP